MLIPTIEDVKLLAAQMQQTPEYAQRWYDMMTAKQWCQRPGVPIQNWQGMMRTFIRNGYRLPVPAKEEVTTTTTQTTTTVRREWHDPMLTLPHLIELDRQRQADYEQYLREKDTPEYKAARQKALSRFGLTE